MILNLFLPFFHYFIFPISFFLSLSFSLPFFLLTSFILYCFSFLCSISGSLSSLFICQSMYLFVYPHKYIHIYVYICACMYAYICICTYVYSAIGVRHIYTDTELSTYDYLLLMYGNHPFSSLNPSTLQPSFFLYFNSCVL